MQTIRHTASRTGGAGAHHRNESIPNLKPPQQFAGQQQHQGHHHHLCICPPSINMLSMYVLISARNMSNMSEANHSPMPHGKPHWTGRNRGAGAHYRNETIPNLKPPQQCARRQQHQRHHHHQHPAPPSSSVHLPASSDAVASTAPQ